MPELPDSLVAIRNIAVATDFSPWSDRAMQHALVVARRFGAVLHILHTVRPSEFAFVPDLMVQLDQLAERDCENMMSTLRGSHCLDGVEHRCWNLYGECSEVFGDFVRDHQIDLLVLGTRGRSGISKLFLGSVAEEISQCVSCPVLAVGPSTRAATNLVEVKNVLFATDLSTDSATAIPYVLTTAKSWGANIDVLKLFLSANSQSPRRIESPKDPLDFLARCKQDLSVRYHTLTGTLSATVLTLARQNKEDLIVLGLDGHGSLDSAPWASQAYEIVRQSTCPVLGVRSAAR